MLVLESDVRVGIRVSVRVGIRDAWGTKRLGTKRLGYEMSGILCRYARDASRCTVINMSSSILGSDLLSALSRNHLEQNAHTGRDIHLLPSE